MDYRDFENEVYRNDDDDRLYVTYEEIEKLAASKVRGSLLWMVAGLIVSGISGYFFLNMLASGTISYETFGMLLPVVIVLEFAAVFAFSAMTFRASANALKLMFLVYSMLSGITLSVIMLAYDVYSIIYAFGGTVVLFTVLAIYGYVTKEDLTKYGSMLKAGLWALIVTGIINIFLRSDGLMWMSSILGVVVFIIYTAYDVNRIKNSVIEYAIHEDMSIIDKIEIHGALSLYLDFVNLFLYILRIIGRGRD